MFYRYYLFAECALKADIVFVLDGSDSVISREWVVFKESVITMLSSYPIDPITGVTVGCVVFASDVDDTIPIKPHLTPFELTSRIRKLKASRTGTGTSKGIYRMRQLFNTQGRQGVQRIGILIVDGNSRDMVEAERQARLAKNEGTLILVVGVGNDFEDKGEIRRLASRPDLAYEALDFFALRDISSFLSQRFCEGKLNLNFSCKLYGSI